MQEEEKWIEVNGNETTISVTKPGRTVITAYAEDTLGNLSDTNSYTAKYDNVPPTITNPPKITSNKPQQTPTILLNSQPKKITTRPTDTNT